ncbi:hypothetical protein AVEN_246056-1 [Araneus ventricosus]|uniref:Uncharacterized protein n=1 Tax=Araneus ventricosus TaxID=182803 RepID=A0A4Y2WR01_ARAVE|nr:hypothetical protein AVEN_155797-1 [Araneus ventricosus]GBO38622.1 hypothetical protein AVEN_246056-1 [Araneus ventricosus]
MFAAPNRGRITIPEFPRSFVSSPALSARSEFIGLAPTETSVKLPSCHKISMSGEIILQLGVSMKHTSDLSVCHHSNPDIYIFTKQISMNINIPTSGMTS